MSYLDKTKKIPKFGGAIWYVNKGTGDSSNKGDCPDCPFEKIGEAITAMAAGDAGGKMDFHIVWRPLTDDGFIAVA